MANTVARPGRKPRPANQGQRASLGLKVTPDIKNKLDAAAKTNGRTQSQEAEARIHQTFHDEVRAELFHDAIYGSQTAGLLDLFGTVIRNAAASSRGYSEFDDWLSDPEAFGDAEAAITEILNALRPSSTTRSSGHRGRSIAQNRLRDVADLHLPPYANSAARFGVAVRAKIGEVAVDAIKQYLDTAPPIEWPPLPDEAIQPADWPTRNDQGSKGQ